MKNLKLIIRREYNSRVRNKSFLVMTVLSPLILTGLIMLVVYLSSLNKSETRNIAVFDQSGLFVTSFENTERLKFTFLESSSLEEAKILGEVQKFYGLLYIPATINDEVSNAEVAFFMEESPNIEVVQFLEKLLSTRLTNHRLIENGVDLTRIEASNTSIAIKIENFKGEQTSKMSSWIKAIFGGAAGYLLMMFIIIYGNMVMRSVIEEKVSRIIEIIISSVKPFELMMGKIIGTTFAGVTQFLIWIVLGGLLLVVATTVFGIDLQPGMVNANTEMVEQAFSSELQAVIYDISNLPMTTLIISFIIYFIGGYFLYSSVYAAIGAAVDNETDTQQFMFPIILPLMLAMYVGFFSVIENPHGTISVVFSYIPFTSPIVMLMRIPFGVAWWEILLSMLILFITFAATVWFAAKIYRVGILMYGKKPTYKELYKWMKY